MARKKNREYWIGRHQQWLNRQDNKDEKATRKLKKEYDRIARELEKEIADYFQRYGRDNVIEFRVMMQELSEEDRELLFRNMDAFAEKYPEFAHLLPVRESIYQLNRLQGLHYSTMLKLLELGAIENRELERHLRETYGYHYEQMMRELGLGHRFLAMNEAILRDTIYSGWINEENFSDRIWNNKEKLLNHLQNRYRDALARGDNYEKLIKEVRERFGVSYYDARRLVWTEAAFILNQAHLHAYKNAGVEEYELVAIIDRKTSDICRRMHGKVFRFDELEVGVNFPPFHPHCRTTFIGVFEPRTIDPKRFESPDEVREWLGKDDLNWIKGLSADENEAIREYTGTAYRKINGYLRGKRPGSERVKEQIKHIDEAIRKFELKDGIMVYRNVGRDALPSSSERLKDLEGTIYKDDGYMSTSVLREGAFSSYDVMFEITVPGGKGRGAYINEISLFKDEEYEFLIKRGASFRITEVVEEGRMTVIRMEMIDDVE
ncbi:BH3531 [Halalkalibacterium halodurans C-125]|uniref:BH3531 protein n=1 Tax=Halalkalibacterium halodurans (strain ATCC BAA-125 / DSM 18197 / FERM 7344 / JCM 9153 / C-125) TaxID=272558 RepID=Q9K742_HALH5|nr:phage head morphogenesis protein [Halalkalibacterium halodurans]BAB07250.1 BH3531 [Halalkalibacterium halodurans C-125]